MAIFWNLLNRKRAHPFTQKVLEAVIADLENLSMKTKVKLIPVEDLGISALPQEARDSYRRLRLFLFSLERRLSKIKTLTRLAGKSPIAGELATLIEQPLDIDQSLKAVGTKASIPPIPPDQWKDCIHSLLDLVLRGHKEFLLHRRRAA